MSFLLDTDTRSAYLKVVGPVSNRVLQYGGRLYVSTVTLAELRAWLLRRRTAQKYLLAYAGLRQDLAVLDVDETTALRAGEIAAAAFNQGWVIKTPDALLAATALIHGLTLATHNTRDFVRIPGLALVDGLVP